MAKSPNQLLISTLFLATIFVNYFPRATLSDQPCPYPCYPPPTGGTTTPTTPPASTTTPPSVLYPPPTGGFYPPPTGGVYPTPPSGYYPYNNPPPDGGYYGAQPPPDPILPYFPFYYRKPLHRSPDDQSTSAPRSIGRSSLLILLLILCFFYLF